MRSSALALSFGLLFASCYDPVEVSERFVSGTLVVPTRVVVGTPTAVRFEVLDTNFASMAGFVVDLDVGSGGSVLGDDTTMVTDEAGRAQLEVMFLQVESVVVSASIVKPETPLGSQIVEVVDSLGSSTLLGTRTDYATGAGPHSVVAADFDDDGRLDVLTADTFGPSFTLYRGGAGGELHGPFTLYLEAAPRDVIALDVDGWIDGGDDAPEIVAAFPHVDVVHIFDVASFPFEDDDEYTVLEIFAADSIPQHTFSVEGFPRALAVGFVDGDEHLDVVVACANRNQLTVITMDGSGPTMNPFIGDSALPNPMVMLPEQGLAPYAAAMSRAHPDDRDPDAAIGVTVFNATNGLLPALPNSTPSEWPSLSAGGNSPVDVVIGDFDRDGNEDAAVVLSGDVWFGGMEPAFEGDTSVVAGASGVAIHMVQDASLGVPPALVSYPTGLNSQAAVAADINVDGIEDLLVASADNNLIYVLWGTASPDEPFERPDNPPTLVTDEGPMDVIAADLDGDGIPEVISANAAAGTLSVIRQRFADRGEVPPDGGNQAPPPGP